MRTKQRKGLDGPHESDMLLSGVDGGVQSVDVGGVCSFVRGRRSSFPSRWFVRSFVGSFVRRFRRFGSVRFGSGGGCRRPGGTSERATVRPTDRMMMMVNDDGE